jgi:hypothetical protein
MGAIVSLITLLGPLAVQVLPSLLPDDSSILRLLKDIVPRIPGWIKSGEATVELYDKVMEVIRENRPPSSAEWDALEADISEMQARVRDTSRDV